MQTYGDNLLPRVLQIVNIMDGYWIKFNIRATLIHLEKWMGSDPITQSTDALQVIHILKNIRLQY